MAQVDATYNARHVDGDAGFDLSISLGPGPDVNTLPVAGHYDSWATGSVVLTDGVTTVTAYLQEPFAIRKRSDRGGQWTEVQIRDRRQYWQTRGHITGEYNKPEADGAENAEQSIRALVALCLVALGESSYDVSALPTDFYPYVRWEMAKPGQEASRLCEMVNCVLGWASDGTPKIYELGVGIAIPAGYTERYDLGTQKVDRPDRYVVRGAQNIVQRTSDLEAVGLDTDGTVQAIEDLSYYADMIATWGSVATGQVAGFVDWWPSARYDCALKSIGRWFRVVEADRIYLPALTTICEVEAQDGKWKWKKPRVSSTDSVRQVNPVSKLAEGMTDLNANAWDLDEAAGIVKLETVPWHDATLAAFADVQLTWAHRELNASGALIDNCFYWRVAGGGGLPSPTLYEQIIPAEWLQLRKTIAGGVTTELNRDDLDAVADKIIGYVDPGATTLDSAEIVYPGIKFIFTDGRVRRVTWHVGADGATTSIVYNTERPPLGGPRLDRKVAALRRQLEASLGATQGIRAQLAGVAIPDPAPQPRRESGGVDRTIAHECRRVYNASDVDAPSGAVVWFHGGWESPRGTERVRQPEYPGVSQVGVAIARIPAHAAGYAAVMGRHAVLAENAASQTVGQRLGAQAGSWNAAVDDLGPLFVAGLLDATRVVVDIRRERGDAQYVRCNVSGAYRAIKLGRGLTIFYIDDGKFRIDPVA